MKNIVTQRERGSLVVISGPSGAGKDTVVQEVLKRRPKSWLSISCTTRPMRPNDVEGRDYYFLTNEEFEEKIRNNEFLEYAKYNGYYYGTPKEHVEKCLANGTDVFLVVEVQGALKIKELWPETICIFIVPTSMEELIKRLVGRKTESKEAILRRFKIAYQEINQITNYNYVVTNDVVDNAAEKVSAILVSEKCRVDRIEELYLGNEEEAIHELLMEENYINEDIKL